MRLDCIVLVLCLVGTLSVGTAQQHQAEQGLALHQPSQSKLDAFTALPADQQTQLIQDGTFRRYMLDSDQGPEMNAEPITAAVSTSSTPSLAEREGGRTWAELIKAHRTRQHVANLQSTNKVSPSLGGNGEVFATQSAQPSVSESEHPKFEFHPAWDDPSLKQALAASYESMAKASKFRAMSKGTSDDVDMHAELRKLTVKAENFQRAMETRELRMKRQSNERRSSACPHCADYAVSRQLYISQFGSLDSTDCSASDPCLRISQAQSIVAPIRAPNGDTVFEYVLLPSDPTDTNAGITEPSGKVYLYGDDFIVGATAACRANQLMNVTVELSEQFCSGVNLFAGIECGFANHSFAKVYSRYYSCDQYNILKGPNFAFENDWIMGRNVAMNMSGPNTQLQSRACTYHQNVTQIGGTQQSTGEPLYFGNVTCEGRGTATSCNIGSGAFQPPKAGGAPIGLILQGNGKPMKVFTGPIAYFGAFLIGNGNTITFQFDNLPLEANTNLGNMVLVYGRDAASIAFKASAAASKQVYSSGVVTVQKALEDTERSRDGLRNATIIANALSGATGSVALSIDLFQLVGNTVMFRGDVTAVTAISFNILTPSAYPGYYAFTLTVPLPTGVVPALVASNGHMTGIAFLLLAPVRVIGSRVVTTSTTSITYEFFVQDTQCTPALLFQCQIPKNTGIHFEGGISLV